MTATSEKGNNPDLWKQLLLILDERLQFGLLDHLQRISSYHFEDDILFIDPGSAADEAYLTKNPVLQQLQLLAHDIVGVREVKIKRNS